MSGQIDLIKFRNALGQFATGVTIITTKDQENSPVGVTASSFNSVSLDPPLVLWSLAKTAKSYKAFMESGCFIVHVLSAEQEKLSNQFAKADTDKFAGVSWRNGFGEAPLLDGCAARFQCQTTFKYDGGDHVILVGEVKQFDQFPKKPLIFHSGKYADARHKEAYSADAVANLVDLDGGHYDSELFLYLLGRSFHQLNFPLLKSVEKAGLSEQEHFVLSVLSMESCMPLSKLITTLESAGKAPDREELDSMVQKGLVSMSADAGSDTPVLSIADQGRSAFIKVLAEVKSIEQGVLSGINASDLDAAKRVLQIIVEKTAVAVVA